MFFTGTVPASRTISLASPPFCPFPAPESLEISNTPALAIMVFTFSVFDFSGWFGIPRGPGFSRLEYFGGWKIGARLDILGYFRSKGGDIEVEMGIGILSGWEREEGRGRGRGVGFGW